MKLTISFSGQLDFDTNEELGEFLDTLESPAIAQIKQELRAMGQEVEAVKEDLAAIETSQLAIKSDIDGLKAWIEGHQGGATREEVADLKGRTSTLRAFADALDKETPPVEPIPEPVPTAAGNVVTSGPSAMAGKSAQKS